MIYKELRFISFIGLDAIVQALSEGFLALL